MFLYKFRKFDKFSKKALRERNLYFSGHKDFNDPTENMFSLLGPQIQDIHQPTNDLTNKIGILCMAYGEKSDVDCSVFHWTYYGDALKGFCLKFRKDALLSSLGEVVIHHGEVKYRKYYSLLDSEQLISNDWGLEELPGVCFKDRNGLRIRQHAFFQKKSDFEKEREYRLIKNDSGAVDYDSKCLEFHYRQAATLQTQIKKELSNSQKKIK